MAHPIDFEPAAHAVASLVPQVGDDLLAARTPCDDYRVADLLYHLLGLSVAFRDAARKDLGPTTGSNPQDMVTDLPDDWRTLLCVGLDGLAEAWRDPAGYDGQTQVGGVTLPGVAAAQFGLNELVLHGWDLARATGQDFGIDEGSLQVSHDLLAALQDPAQRGGIFKPVVPVPSEAPLLDRVVGLAGRDPAWSSVS